MVLADDLTTAVAPFATTYVTEIIAAQTCHVVTACLFLNHMTAVAAAHVIHLAAILRDCIHGLCSEKLVLVAGHASVPF